MLPVQHVVLFFYCCYLLDLLFSFVQIDDDDDEHCRQLKALKSTISYAMYIYFMYEKRGCRHF